MRTLPLKANHKRIPAYHASLADFERLGVKHETAVRAAFQALLGGLHRAGKQGSRG